MRTLPARLVLTAGLMAAAVLFAACGGTPAPQPAPQQAPALSGATALNPADVTFLQDMRPHHEQATRMARLIPQRTDRPELRAFADRILAAQSAEIDEMNGLLQAAGRPAQSSGMGGMAMPGMLDESALQRLEGLRGREFEMAFLDHMTRHHQGAIKMAEQVLKDGQSPRAKDLADRIIAAQNAEIDQMAVWRQQWVQP